MQKTYKLIAFYKGAYIEMIWLRKKRRKIEKRVFQDNRQFEKSFLFAII